MSSLESIKPVDTPTAFQFYESVRHRLPTLPSGSAHVTPISAPDLLSLQDQFDVFVFDAFGVLNVGDTAIDGAPDVIEKLKAMGKHVYVLTNGATAPLVDVPEKFKRLGFRFAEENIISSRAAAERVLENPPWSMPSNPLWGAICGGRSLPDDFPVRAIELEDDSNDYSRVDAFVMLSSLNWNEARQSLWVASMRNNPRPVIVANPDVIAPHESRFSFEPGYYVHRLAEQLPIDIAFHGKPFESVFTMIRQRVTPSIADKRIAMLGDTLHTDVLGAACAGWTSILVTAHGLFRGVDVTGYIESSGIRPDYIIPSI